MSCLRNRGETNEGTTQSVEQNPQAEEGEKSDSGEDDDGGDDDEDDDGSTEGEDEAEDGDGSQEETAGKKRICCSWRSAGSLQKKV